MSDKTPGQIAYEKYMELHGCLETVKNEAWNRITKGEQKTWEETVQAVLDAQPCPHPFVWVTGWKDADGILRQGRCLKCNKEL